MHGIESLKKRIRNGDRVVGASVRMWATQSDVDRTLSFADYDFLAVDAQHSPFSEENLVNICEIANDMGVPIQLRIKHTRLTFLIGNMLDLGPSMIEIPHRGSSSRKFGYCSGRSRQLLLSTAGAKELGPITQPSNRTVPRSS